MDNYEKQKPRANGGKTFSEVYSTEHVEALKQLIARLREQGKTKFFSISIDDELIVQPTDQLEAFDGYLDFMQPFTKKVEIRLYFGRSPNCNRYVFHMHPQSLQGIPSPDIETRLEQALEKQRLETQVMLLQNELKRKKKKLKAYKHIQAELDDKQIDIKELLTKGMELYGQYQASKLPGVNGVQGLPPAAQVEIEAEVSEVDRFYQRLKESCTEKELQRAIRTWEIITKYPELRQEFSAIINSKNQSHG